MASGAAMLGDTENTRLVGRDAGLSLILLNDVASLLVQVRGFLLLAVLFGVESESVVDVECGGSGGEVELVVVCDSDEAVMLRLASSVLSVC